MTAAASRPWARARAAASTSTWTCISGFTLMAIPGVASDNYKLTVTARSAGGKTRQYVLDDGMTTVIWLPLIVTAPFSNPVAVAPKVNQNMYRNLLQNLENDGMIPKAIYSKTGN
jgi:hypothetical protein